MCQQPKQLSFPSATTTGEHGITFWSRLKIYCWRLTASNTKTHQLLALGLSIGNMQFNIKDTSGLQRKYSSGRRASSQLRKTKLKNVYSGMNGIKLSFNNTSTHCYSAITHCHEDANHHQNLHAAIAHWLGSDRERTSIQMAAAKVHLLAKVHQS